MGVILCHWGIALPTSSDGLTEGTALDSTGQDLYLVAFGGDNRDIMNLCWIYD